MIDRNYGGHGSDQPAVFLIMEKMQRDLHVALKVRTKRLKVNTVRLKVNKHQRTLKVKRLFAVQEAFGSFLQNRLRRF